MPDPSIADRLRGVFAPVTTPFDSVSGDVAPIPWRDNLRRWCEQPLDGLVLFGSTGEGALLDEEEKVRLTGFARDVVPAGIPLVVGASAESTRATIRQAKRMAEAGADAILTHPPAYFGPYLAPSALRDYYRDLRARPDTTSQAERAFAAERVSVENALGLVDLFALEDLEPL